MAAGVSAIRPMTLVPPGSLRFPNAAEAAGFEATRHFDEKEILYLDRFAQFAAVAAREAVASARLQRSHGRPRGHRHGLLHRRPKHRR